MNPVGFLHHRHSSNAAPDNGTGGIMRAPLMRVLLATSLVAAGLWIAACGGGSDSIGPVEVASVTVGPAANALSSLGETVQLTAVVADSSGHVITGETVSWASSNTAVATVNSSGLVTATGNGTAAIVATAGGVSGGAQVTVQQVITSVAVTPGTSTLVSFGETLQLTATPKDANGNAVAGQTVTWSSSNNGVATVSPLGLVTAVANGGPVTMTATVGAISGTATATVAQAVATVDVTPGTTTLAALGSTVQLSAAPKDANGNPVLGQTVIWSSSNASIAMIGPTGLVTAMATGGPVTLTGTVGGKSGTASVTVAQAVVAVAVTPPTTTMVSFGETLQLTAIPTDANGATVNGLPVTWLSSNTAVATVSASGLVTAVSNGGPVTVTATVSGKFGTATITVEQHVNSVAVTPGTTTLTSLGATQQLTATPTDANGNVVAGQTVAWSSSDAGVAAVNGSGLVTAVANGGPVTFTATIGGKSGTATVTVGQVVNAVVVTPGATTLASLGATVQLTATPEDANHHPVLGQTVTWTSSNTSVAMVGPSGLVTAMATGGPVTITASAGGKSGTAAVTVAQAVASVSVTPPATTLGALGATLQLTATALDANGIEVTGLPVTWSSSNALVASVSATGLVTAVANGGPVTITATVTGKSGTASVSVSQVVAAVAVTPPTTTLVSVGGTVQLSAAPTDANGNPVPGQTATWSSSDVTSSIVTVNATGLVTAVANGGPVTVTATIGGKSGTASVSVAQVVASVSITTQPGSPVQNGVTFPTVPVVTVKDALGTGVANQTVTVSVASGGALTFANGTATTNASGVATFTALSASGLVGARTLRFSVGAVQSPASNSVTVNAGLPAAVAITTQPAATVQSGVTFGTVPVVTVTDASGNLVPNQSVTVSVASGGALSFTNGTATTNSNGLATFTGLAAGGVIGARTLQFTAGTAVSAASATVTVTGGAPAIVTITSQPSATAQSGVAFAAAPVVTVTDGAGNVVPNQAVTVSVASGSALTFTSGSATTDANGIATFTGLSAVGLVGDRTLAFTAGTAVSNPSSTVTLTAGAAATVTITTQPSATVQSGVAFPTAPVVTVRDAATNLVPNQVVTVSVASGSALTFTNGSATTNGSGVATFTGLAGAGVIGARTLQFTAGTAISAASNSVTVNAGLPATVTITTQPSATAQSGVAFATVPAVTVTDAAGNLVSGQAVTVSVGSGGALTFTNGSATTDGSGIATFTGLSATGVAGDRTLLFAAGTAVSPASNTVSISAGLAAAIAITTQPGSPVQSGVAFATVPVVTVTDGGGNPVPNQSVTVSVATGGALTFTNGTASTNGSGVATFTGLAATGVIGSRTLRFTAGTVNSAATTAVQVNAGLPATVNITTQPAATVQTGVVFPTVPVVTVTDGAGNVVGSTPVTVSVATGGALTFTAGTATTNGSGVATFTGLIATGAVGPRTLQFTAGTAVSAPSNTVTVNGGPPASVTINTQPAATVQSGVVFPTVPVITVKDASANPVANQAVTVSVVTGTALTFVNGTATTDVNGVATFTNLTASGLIGSRTLRFTAGTANSVASTAVQVNAGLPATVTITTQPSASVQNSVAFPQVPVVTVRDAATNLVPSTPVIVSVASGSPLTFTNGTATTDVNGVATFTGLAVSGALGARTLQFTAGTAVSVPSTSVTLTTGALAQIIVTPASNMLISTGQTKQLSYSAQDAGGNPLNPQPAITSWTSSNTNVVTVSATGLVTAGATNGTVTITATIGTVSGTTTFTRGQIAVVTNNLSDDVTILNGTTVQATRDVGVGPRDLAITADGSTAWILNNQGSSIQTMTLGTNVVSAPVGSSNPRGIALSGNVAFIIRGLQDPALQTLSTTDFSELGYIPFPGKSLRAIAVTSSAAYFTDSSGTATNGQVYRYDRNSGEITDSVPTGLGANGIAINPAGTRLYVTNRDSNSVTVINTSNMTRVATIQVGSQPLGVKVTPNGNFVYVANMGGNTVSVISTATNTVTATVTVGSNPAGLAITAAGDLVYVANSGSDTVSLISTATNTVTGSPISVGDTPMHIALRDVP